jgi:hypothetical protein
MVMLVGRRTSGAVKVTEQLPDERVHCDEEKVPPPPDEKVTTPVGVTGEPAPVSVTVAVQVELARVATELGLQTTVTETGLWETRMLVVWEPPLCSPSPE